MGQKTDFEYGFRDRMAGFYDKWYRYNRKDNGAEYDLGMQAALKMANHSDACTIIEGGKYGGYDMLNWETTSIAIKQYQVVVNGMEYYLCHCQKCPGYWMRPQDGWPIHLHSHDIRGAKKEAEVHIRALESARTVNYA